MIVYWTLRIKSPLKNKMFAYMYICVHITMNLSGSGLLDMSGVESMK